MVSLALGQGWFRPKSPQDRIQKVIQLYNEGRYGASEAELNKLKKYPDIYSGPAVTFLHLKILSQENQFPEARQLARKLLASADTRYRPYVYETLGDMFVNEGNYTAAFRQYLLARKAAGDQSQFWRRIDNKLMKSIGLDIQEGTIDELLALEEDTTIATILQLVKGFKYLSQGESDRAALILSTISPEYVPDAFFPVYEKMLLTANKPRPKNTKIGIVASLTGDQSSVSRTFLKGMNQALIHHLQSGAAVSFMIIDNRSDAIETVQAMKTLEQNPDISAVIAPLGAKSALLSAGMAPRLSIPVLIPTSTQDGITSLSENIFQCATPLEKTGAKAARYIVETLGYDTIAVLAPADDYGKAIVDAFIKQLDLMGVYPVSLQWYSGIPQSLKSEFSALRKTAWSLVPKESSDEEFLGLEMDSLDAIFDISEEDFFDLPEENNKKLTKSDSVSYMLETIQALFIPARPEHITYIGTQFPQYNLKTTIVGTESWYNRDIINEESIGSHLNGMIVLSNQYPGQNNAMENPIVPEGNPATFFLGYDLGQLLFFVTSQQPSANMSLTQQLAQVQDYHGLAYSWSFRPDDHSNSALHVLRYSNKEYRDLGFFRGDSLVHTQYYTP